jgi:VWFA-related protein
MSGEKLGAAMLLIVVAAISSALAAPPAPAAGAPPPAGPAEPPASTAAPAPGDQGFGEEIEVTVVNVDVVVRDRSGRQVGGLTRDDFSLLIDGKKVPIANFSSQAAAPDAALQVPPDAALPAPPGAAKPPADANLAAARERLSLAVFVDNADMRQFDRNRLLKQLRVFLHKTLQPGDQALVVTHDVKGLHVRHSLGDSPATLDQTLDQLQKDPAGGLERDHDLRTTMSAIYEIIEQQGCADGVDQAVGLARAHEGKVLSSLKAAYGDLHNLLNSLAGVEGRKALVYAGDGMASQVGTDISGLIAEICPEHSSHSGFNTLDATAPLRQVIADANASRVTIFTLEATGQASYVAPDNLPVSVELSRSIDLDRQASLFDLARETGGRAALNGSDFRHDLEEIAAEIASSYSLGFTPPAGPPGRMHKIKVEINRPGLSATYRGSYTQRTAEERMEAAVEAALIHGQVDNPLGATVKLGAAARPAAGAGGRITVPLTLRVPFARLTFLPRQDGQHGQVTIYVANMDDRGGLAPIQRVQLPLRIQDADARRVLASQMGYEIKLLVEPGRQRIALAVRDDVARISSSLIQEVDVDRLGTATAVAPGAARPQTR